MLTTDQAQAIHRKHRQGIGPEKLQSYKGRQNDSDFESNEEGLRICKASVLSQSGLMAVFFLIIKKWGQHPNIPNLLPNLQSTSKSHPINDKREVQDVFFIIIKNAQGRQAVVLFQNVESKYPVLFLGSVPFWQV